MTESKFYHTDPDDPDAPVVLGEYKGLKVGDKVVYANTAWQGLTGGMDGVYTITEIISFAPEPYVNIVLDDGEWEVNADNLAPAPVGKEEGPATEP